MLLSPLLARQFALSLLLISLTVAAKILIGPSASASSNAGDLDTTFDPGIGATVGGAVQALIVQADGKIVIGGSFSGYDGTLRNGIARVNSDGTLDTSFDSAVGFNNTVYALALQSDGKILAGGAFTKYNGVTQNRIARLNIDGSLDTSFVPGVSLTTHAIAIQTDGRIIVGAETSPFLRRLNSDGSLDSTFHPNINGTVKTIAIQSDGKLVFGGTFFSVNSSQRQYLARINNDGTLDNSFTPLLSVTGNGVVNSVCLQTDGKVIVGGKLARPGGLPLSALRLNVDGSSDSSFASFVTSGVVSSVVIQPDGKVLYGGAFTAFYSAGVTRSGIERVNSDGSLDTSFDPGSGVNTAYVIAIQTNGAIVLGGEFTNYNGTGRNGIARVNSDGALDMTLNPGGGTARVGIVSAVSIQTDGKIILAGMFSAYNNIARNSIARVNSDGSLDSSFNPGSVTASSSIYSMAIQNDGRILIGGSFSSVDGISRNGVARLNVDGAVDMSFNPGTGTNGPVIAVTVQSDNKVILGGAFTAYNGGSRSGIARINADGSLDASFNPGTGADNFVNAVAVQSDEKILLAGLFSSYNSVTRPGIARINNNGTLDTSFDPGTGASNSDPQGNALQIQPDGKIVLSGSFSTYNGTSRNAIARVNGDGSLDMSFDPGTGATFGGFGGATVVSLVIQADGKILAGGSFFNYNGVVRQNIVRINTNGTLDTSFDPGSGPSNIVSSLALQSDGKILLGGQFSTYNGVTRNGIARILSAPSSPTPTPTPTPTPIPTPTPTPIQLLLDQSGPAPDQVAALDSVLLVRDPFPVINEANSLNLESDRNTRVVIFVGNLQLLPGEGAAAVVVNLIDSNNQSYDLSAEDVRQVPNLSFLQVVFRLPNNLAVGPCTVRVKAHGEMSNNGTFRIRT